MRFARRLVVGGIVALLAACGSEAVTTEPGALTITLNGPPPTLTNTATLQITGQVTRTPAAAVGILVTATGAVVGDSDSAAADGSFALTVTLTANAQNTLSITASDQSGSSATPVSIGIRHDGAAPQVTGITPASGSDGVTPATIQVVFGEAVVPGSATFALRVYGVAVPGSAILSPDSLTLTFTPSAPLVSNAIYDLSVAGAADAVGNALVSAGGCFVTGGPGITAFVDTSTVLYQYGSPAGLVAPDLLELRLARTTTTLHGILEFNAPRTLSPTANNNTSVWIDLDVDQDGATGFVPYKDVAFAGFLPSSDAGSEYFIEMGTLDAVDGALVAQIMAQDTSASPPTWSFTPTDQPTPGSCGSVLGFAVPFAAIGSDDGAFDIAIYIDVFRPDPPIGSAIIDPAPDAGVFSAAVTAAAGGLPALGTADSWTGPPARAIMRRSVELRRR